MTMTPRDHALAIFKAGLNAVPYVGGVVASLIEDYIPSSTQRNIEATIDLLKQRLCDLEGRIDPESVDKDEFAELFKTCYLIVVRTHQASKRRAAVELMTNILLKNGDPLKMSYTELDHFARCLESLSVGAIGALGQVVSIAREQSRGRFGRENVQITFRQVHARLPEFEPGLIMGLLGELNSFHLVHLTDTPSVRTENYGNYPIELPPIGAKFAQNVLRDEH